MLVWVGDCAGSHRARATAFRHLGSAKQLSVLRALPPPHAEKSLGLRSFSATLAVVRLVYLCGLWGLRGECAALLLPQLSLLVLVVGGRRKSWSLCQRTHAGSACSFQEQACRLRSALRVCYITLWQQKRVALPASTSATQLAASKRVCHTTLCQQTRLAASKHVFYITL